MNSCSALNTLITCAAVGVTGSELGRLFDRPPLICGAFLGAAFLIKKAVTNNCFVSSADPAKQDFFASIVDSFLPNLYYSMAEKHPFFEKYNIDFCAYGSFMTYYITQKTGNVVEHTLHLLARENSNEKTISESPPPPLWSDVGYTLTAAIFGASIPSSMRKRRFYAALAGSFALVEKISMRCIPVLKENLHAQKIFKSLLHLGPVFETFDYFYLQRIFETNINGYKYRNIYMKNNLLWNGIKYANRFNPF